MSDELRSQHPVDRLIRELIATRRIASMTEMIEIVDRIANAPFDPRVDRPVLTEHRGISYQEQTLGARASALIYHLMKRVLIDRQWAHGTTSLEYLADLRGAVRASDARLFLYERRGGHMAAIISRNGIQRARLGLNSLPWLLVAYSADRGTIVSGYQVSSDPPDNIPEDALWSR